MWGQTVVVDNRGGAGGNIGGADRGEGGARRLHAVLDLGLGRHGEPAHLPNMPFNPEKDLVAVTNVVQRPADGRRAPPVPPTRDAEGADRAARGEARASSTSAPPASAPDASRGGELPLRGEASTCTHVPYKGEGPALVDLVAGQIDMRRRPTSPPSIGFVKQGKLRALGGHQQGARAAAARRADRRRDRCPASRTPAGSASSRRPARRGRSSTRSTATRSRRWTRPRCADALRRPGHGAGRQHAGRRSAKAMREERTRWAKVVRERKHHGEVSEPGADA